MNKLAPIVLFTYNRPYHTKKTLEALANNYLAKESVLYIYCDGVPINSSEENKNNNKLVKEVIREKKWCKEVHIIESSINKGLANSVINAVHEVVNMHGKIIVLEDDLITTKTFLKYMNDALNSYENDKGVIQISGFSFPSKETPKLNASFFLNITSTWGWATWKDSWNELDFVCKDYSKLKEDKKLAKEFNLGGIYNYTKMFVQQMESEKVSSWGIRFYWNAFKKKASILYPDKSLVKNIGWDSSGRHKDSYEIFPIIDWDDEYEILNFPDTSEVVEEKADIVHRYLKQRTSLKTKILSKLSSIFSK